MSEETLAPGPWQYGPPIYDDNEIERGRFLRGSDGSIVAFVDVENQKNANVLAASRDMLEAMEGLVGTTLCPQGVGCKDGCEAVYAAIARARGQTWPPTID